MNRSEYAAQYRLYRMARNNRRMLREDWEGYDAITDEMKRHYRKASIDGRPSHIPNTVMGFELERMWIRRTIISTYRPPIDFLKDEIPIHYQRSAIASGLRRMEQRAARTIERLYCAMCGDRRSAPEIEVFEDTCFHCACDQPHDCPECDGAGCFGDQVDADEWINEESCWLCEGSGNWDDAFENHPKYVDQLRDYIDQWERVANQTLVQYLRTPEHDLDCPLCGGTGSVYEPSPVPGQGFQVPCEGLAGDDDIPF